MTAPIVFDHDLIVRHLQRRQAGAEDFVTSLALYDLQDRLLAVTRRFEQALIMGPDATVLPERGETHDGVFSFERAGTAIAAPGQLLLDPEDLALPRSDYDLIVSIFDLQIVNDVPGFLARLRRHLRPDGLLLAAAIGGNTLTELRQAFLTADVSRSGGAYARVAPFIEIKDAGALLQRAGFALPVADVENHVVRYAHPLSLMQDLKRLGASNPLADRPERMATASLLAGAAEAYKDLAGDPDGRIRATLEIIWMSGWAPHESQQKPLAPGSAKVSMTRILGDKAGS